MWFFATGGPVRAGGKSMHYGLITDHPTLSLPILLPSTIILWTEEMQDHL